MKLKIQFDSQHGICSNTEGFDRNYLVKNQKKGDMQRYMPFKNFKSLKCLFDLIKILKQKQECFWIPEDKNIWRKHSKFENFGKIEFRK